MFERSVNEAFARELASRQNADGGWGAAPGALSNTECTALAHLALASMPMASPGSDPEAAVRWLLTCQAPGGAWPYHSGGPVPSWPTAIVLLALHGRVDTAAAVGRGFDWLLQQRGWAMPWWIRLREWFLGRKQVVELDPTLQGWPWAPGAFSWIEPTAWALTALKAKWPNAGPSGVRSRIHDGEAMILDRECPGGGWNYGNKRVLEQDFEPYPDTTALALLGLRGREASEVDAGFKALDRLLDEHASGLALSLGVLCRRAWGGGRDAAALQARLAARYEAGGFLGETRTLALAVLAFAPTTDWLGGGERHG